jgi:hypothetical protein
MLDSAQNERGRTGALLRAAHDRTFGYFQQYIPERPSDGASVKIPTTAITNPHKALASAANQRYIFNQ